MSDTAIARRNMIDGQLRPNAVTHSGLLAVMAELPREAFVPPALASIAYSDDDLPLPGGRYMMEPMVLARLLQAAQPRAEDKALVVGAGTGYGAAVLAGLVQHVTALEQQAELGAIATRAFGELGLRNVAVTQGPLEAGWPEGAPYDLILVEGAISDLPGALAAQIADGGRLVAVWSQGPRPGQGTARLTLKSGGNVSSRKLFDAATPHLPGFVKSQAFVFPA
jgi:protein-L-isoaspartate(D-aspartate) O-methyltransferase